MATVLPFKGITFDRTRIPDLGEVTCPPYDVISDDDRRALYDRHPYNVVRIVSGADEPGDNGGSNRYTRAAGFFDSWRWEGVLRTSEEPALYVVRQTYNDPAGKIRRVWGLIATISLDDEILAHEHTMSGPKADRLALMHAVPANISPIWAIYNSAGHPDADISATLREFASADPITDFTDSDGTRHTVWEASSVSLHDSIREALNPLPLMIADGHHRFATAGNYRDEVGSEEATHVMCLLMDAAVEPILILPYNRIVTDTAVNDIAGTLKQNFEITELGPIDTVDPDELGAGLWNETRKGVFIGFWDGLAHRLVAKNTLPDDIPAGILKREALIPLGATDAETHLSFTPHAQKVAQAVAGGAPAGFLIQPVDVADVWRIGASGAQMPEKSTFFHPKPKDGIVMRSLRDQ